MVRLIARRLALGVMTIMLVSVVIFAGLELLPGDACTAYLGQAAQGKRLDNCRKDFGLKRPPMTRYVEWIGGAVRGDFGISLKDKNPSPKRSVTVFVTRSSSALLRRWWGFRSPSCSGSSRPSGGTAPPTYGYPPRRYSP